jgi:phosphoribosyl 1,2-cyclic phosphodiesterase
MQAIFDVWGSRGSRSTAPGSSRIGSNTSCYSLYREGDLYVFDAGRGLAVLSDAIATEARFRSVKRIHILVTHAHLDHWEGLKDAAWFWTKNNGLDVNLFGTQEALSTIVSGLAAPAFVPLDVLAIGTVAKLTWTELKAGQALNIGGAAVEALALNHYSGMKDSRRMLDTIGYRVGLPDGPSVAYLSDHEPIPETQPMEDAAARGAHLVLLDSQFADRKDHAFGHGSQEHAAATAKRHLDTLIVAGHHGPRTDEHIETGHRRHSVGLSNLALAIEGKGFVWDAAKARFERPNASFGPESESQI